MDQKLRRLAEEEKQAVTPRAFSAYGIPLFMVTSFQYLGRMILAADDDFLDVVSNFSSSRSVWKIMTRVLSRDGVEPRVSWFFFKTVVRALLLFRAGTCVVTPRMVRLLGGSRTMWSGV